MHEQKTMPWNRSFFSHTPIQYNSEMTAELRLVQLPPFGEISIRFQVFSLQLFVVITLTYRVPLVTPTFSSNGVLGLMIPMLIPSLPII